MEKPFYENNDKTKSSLDNAFLEQDFILIGLGTKLKIWYVSFNFEIFDTLAYNSCKKIM